MQASLLQLFGLLPDGAIRGLSRVLFSASWKRFQEAVREPERVQRQRLEGLLYLARDTEFGREHGFSDIKTLEDYQARVPVRNYEAFEPYLSRMVAGEKNVLLAEEPFFYGRSSGTTGTPKYIPVTGRFVDEYRRPRRVWARQVIQAFPGLVRGKILTMHSPALEGRTEQEVPYGSVTVGLTTKPGQPGGALKASVFDVGPRSVYLIKDFDLKYACLLRLAAQQKVSLAAAINPSTLVLLSERLAAGAEQLADDLETGRFYGLDALDDNIRADVQAKLTKAPKAAARLRQAIASGTVRPVDLWPEVCGLLCWKGGSAPFYLAQLEHWFPGRAVMDYGFLATEGGFSIPLDPAGADGVTSILGHVLEFVPEDQMTGPHPPAVLANALEKGRRYRVLVSGAHGLYRYDINDVVECTGHYEKTARIAFVHKGGNMLSLTGEKVSEQHVVEAAGLAEKATGIAMQGFSVGCALTQPPHYVVAVEPRTEIGEAESAVWLAAFEAALKEVNLEYEAKRNSKRLASPELRLVPRGGFANERARRVAAGAPDSHVKPPHLVRDIARIDALVESQ